MEHRFQFSVKNALLATMWFVFWCVNWRFGGSIEWIYSLWNQPSWVETAEKHVFLFLLAGLPAAFIGALSGRHIHGLLCGVASGLAVVAYQSFN
jgi:hypothetical protein